MAPTERACEGCTGTGSGELTMEHSCEVGTAVMKSGATWNTASLKSDPYKEVTQTWSIP